MTTIEVDKRLRYFVQKSLKIQNSWEQARSSLRKAKFTVPLFFGSVDFNKDETKPMLSEGIKTRFWLFSGN